MEMSPFLFGLYKFVKFLVYPTSWLVLLTALIAILAFASPSPRRLRWIRFLALTSLILFLLLANPFLSRTLFGLLEIQAAPFDPDPSRRFDAIVVLSGGIYDKGSLRPREQLSYSSLLRTMCGADLYTRGLAPKIVLSGGDAKIFGRGPHEALEMKHFALRVGVPEDAILVEDGSRTTHESAVETKRLLGPASIVLATSAHHLPRSEALFRRQGFRVSPYPCSYGVRNRPGDLSDLTPFDMLPTVEGLFTSTGAIDELAGMLAYRLVGKL